ncbi:MAG: transglutaminase domain-containing protein [bacterium]|nr:MAG: transglutaminase domain-containing protein [bacterium]
MALALVLLPGCRDQGTVTTDPASRFGGSDEGVARTLGIYSGGGQRVGTHRAEQRRGLWDSSVRAIEVVERTELNLSFRGDRFTIHTDQTSYLEEESLELLASASTIDFGGQRWKTRWVREGMNRYRKTESLGGSERTEIQTVPAGVLTMDAMDLLLARMAFDGDRDRSRRIHLYNMTLGRSLPVEVSWKGRQGPERGFVLSIWGMEEEIWLDENGLVLRETMPWGGITARGTVPGERQGPLSLEEVFSKTSVAARDIPESLRYRNGAVLVLRGVQDLPPQTPWQRVEAEGDTVTVRLTRPDMASGIEAGGAGPVDAAGDENRLNLTDPRIKELAGEITGELTDPWEKALAIGAWVYGNMGKSMRECLTAIEALEAGEGECQSHSLLMVALCRVSGIPARFLYGAVYLPDRGAYLFHTWVDVFVGRWMPVDPTLGHFPAGVDHLVLGMGSYMDQFQVFPFVLGAGNWSIAFKPDEAK